jgi:AcrR family transcriptional regulator
MDSELVADPVVDPMTAAIDVFTRHGYDATTVDDLADAAGLSRSTFFRRYGSKEDVVFADHEFLLGRVHQFFEATTLQALPAVCAAARLVFAHHVARPDVSTARFALLHDVPALRDRELITSHRYERAFTGYLRHALPDDDRRDYVSIAFSAAVVAVHNAVLRQWFTDPQRALGAVLDEQLRSLTRAFAPPRKGSGARRVVVTVFDADADREDILETIRGALP